MPSRLAKDVHYRLKYLEAYPEACGRWCDIEKRILREEISRTSATARERFELETVLGAVAGGLLVGLLSGILLVK